MGTKNRGGSSSLVYSTCIVHTENGGVSSAGFLSLRFLRFQVLLYIPVSYALERDGTARDALAEDVVHGRRADWALLAQAVLKSLAARVGERRHG